MSLNVPAAIQNTRLDPNLMRVVIAGREIYMESAELVRTMDTGCDALTGTFPWTFGQDPFLDRIARKYSYSPVQVFMGARLVTNLIMYDVTNQSNAGGSTKQIDCFSKTADIIDSTVQAPYEENRVSLLNRCKSQCSNFGINVSVDPMCLQDANAPFPRVDAEPTDNLFEHLAKLSAQRGCLLSCTKTGDLYITKARTVGVPVGTIFENLSPDAEQYVMKFSGRNRFQKYNAIATSAGALPQTILPAIDPKITRSRFLTFKADDSLPGESINAALWRRNKAAADSYSTDFPVNSWYSPFGLLWEPNTLVTVFSQTMENLTGFTYLITQVKYTADNDRSTAVLTLKPPQLYTKDPVVLEP